MFPRFTLFVFFIEKTLPALITHNKKKFQEEIKERSISSQVYSSLLSRLSRPVFKFLQVLLQFILACPTLLEDGTSAVVKLESRHTCYLLDVHRHSCVHIHINLRINKNKHLHIKNQKFWRIIFRQKLSGLSPS